jgi:endogenous inhibitor of DNA gyrase (YacG/DUF329 family)
VALQCPTCGRAFDPAGVETLPFCSVRCRQIDLGRWLGERIGVPVQRAEGDDDESELPEGISRSNGGGGEGED